MPDNFKVNGLEIAEVTEVEKDSHRVKLKFEAWSADETSHWAPVATFMAGKEMGFYCMPNKGDKVLVGFHQGNRHEPYVVGSLWAEKQKPPVTGKNSGSDRNKDEKNVMRYWKTQSGHMIILDDTKNKEKIQIIDKTGKKKIELISGMLPGDKVINIVNEEAHINIEAPKGEVNIKCKKLNIDAEQQIQITAGKKLVLKSSQDEIEVHATKDLKLKGSNVEVEAQQNAKIKGNSGVEAKGAQIKLEASASMSLEASGIATLKGSVVKIN
jgi:uncharacterized protein involved in type VI secretion and phage assembly